jgi:hypothetical protein
MGLVRVFNHRKAACAGDLQNRVHIGGMAVKMCGDDGFGAGNDRAG